MKMLPYKPTAYIVFFYIGMFILGMTAFNHHNKIRLQNGESGIIDALKQHVSSMVDGNYYLYIISISLIVVLYLFTVTPVIGTIYMTIALLLLILITVKKIHTFLTYVFSMPTKKMEQTPTPINELESQP